jgi:hypothetical protein
MTFPLSLPLIVRILAEFTLGDEPAANRAAKAQTRIVTLQD